MESNQRPPGSAEIPYLLRPSFLAQREAASVALPTATTPQCPANQDSDHSSRFASRSTPSGNRTRSASFKGSRRDYAPERVSCGNRTRLASLEGWCLCRSAKGTVSKRKGRKSNPQGREARPDSGGVPSPVGLPFRSLKAPVGGIEPPIIGLTGRRLTVWPHRIMSVRTAGIEPAFSCSQGTRDARLPHVLILRAPSGSRTHTSAMARQ